MPGSDEKLQREWARGIKSSDREAFAALFDAIHQDLLRYAWSLTRDEEAGYDILQEAFLRLWNMRRRIDPERSIEALLYRIVRNLSYKQSRRSGRTERLAEAERDHPVHERMSDEIDARLLERHLASWVEEMPPRRREVFLLSRKSGLSHGEIAEVLDISTKTVNNHLVAALRYLRDCLQQRYSDQRLP